MHAHDHGLEHDLTMLLARTMDRRRALKWLAAGGAASLPLIGCRDGAASNPTAPGAAATASSARCAVIPDETAGPFPGNGSNGNARGVANALTQAGIVRRDIRASFGAAGAKVAPGVPLTIRLTLVDAGCAALAGHAIYIWHCTRDGLYSMYSSGAAGENFLRGVQETDGGGAASFTTIVPGCYPGRVPHVHFEVYPSLAKANAAARIKTSQFTFPMAMLAEAFASDGYGRSAANLAEVSHANDGVFSDGASLQTAAVSGNPGNGYIAALRVAIAV